MLYIMLIPAKNRPNRMRGTEPDMVWSVRVDVKCARKAGWSGLGKGLGKDYTACLCVFVPATKVWVLPESPIS